jgi:DNA-binding HxlR family transcriptional regulator
MAKQYNLPCPVARSLDIVGDRWTLLIVRDLLVQGPRKYVELQTSLCGIAPNVLSDRLKLLEEHGVVEREFYEEHPPRARYKLTRKGRDLRGVLSAFLEWGNKYEYDGVALVHDECGRDVSMRPYCPRCDRLLDGRETRIKYRRPEAAAAVGQAI